MRSFVMGDIHDARKAAGRYGRLTIMELATKQYWPSDKVTDLYSHKAKN